MLISKQGKEIETFPVKFPDMQNEGCDIHGKASPRPPVPVITALSFLALAAGVAIAFLPRPL
ncbi:MAG: hypothetical protein WAK55_07065 [Xanthobacteraceae bacterium]